jgi:glycine/D-amino acid oxidase-like deaminating enzyme
MSYETAPERAVPRITVIGTGYLGATQAICLAELGYDVLGVDVDAAKVGLLAAGQIPFFEPGLPEKLHQALASGRLHFTTDFDHAAEFGDIHFICVGRNTTVDELARRRPDLCGRRILRPRQQDHPQGASGRKIHGSHRHRGAAHPHGPRYVTNRHPARTCLEPRIPPGRLRGP